MKHAPTLQNSLALPTIIKYTSSPVGVRHQQVQIQEKCPQKDLYANAYSSFIQKIPKLETIQPPSTEEWINCGAFIQRKATQQHKKNELQLMELKSKS